MPEVCREIFALAKRRSRSLAGRFLEEFAQGFDEAKNQYEYPAFAAEPEMILFSAAEMLDLVTREANAEYAIYWTNPNAAEGAARQITSAQLHFLADGSMLGGISVATDKPHPLADYMMALAKVLQAEYAYQSEERPPAGSAGLLKTFARTGDPPRLDKGRLVLEVPRGETAGS